MKLTTLSSLIRLMLGTHDFLRPAFGADIGANSGFTGCMTKATLAEGTNSATIKTNATDPAGVHFAIHGIGYYKANADNIAVTAHAQQAVSTSCLYLVQVNSSGTISTKKGTEQLTANLGANLSLQWPEPDADKCPLGGYKIALDASTTFTNGTTDIGAAGVTSTFYDFIGGMPKVPQTS